MGEELYHPLTLNPKKIINKMNAQRTLKSAIGKIAQTVRLTTAKFAKEIVLTVISLNKHAIKRADGSFKSQVSQTTIRLDLAQAKKLKKDLDIAIEDLEKGK